MELPMIDASIQTLQFYVAIGGWIVFALLFFLRKRPPHGMETKRDRRSSIGIVIQGTAYALVWMFRRPPSEPFLGWASDRAVLAVEIALIGASLWLTASAIRTLGAQWTFAARIIEGHELITQGPYGVVRHPIYTGMLGMLLATGFALSVWPVVAVAAGLYLCGFFLRIRVEERLLIETFGEAYREYARRVPVLIPGLRLR